jgi:tellurite resistance protein
LKVDLNISKYLWIFGSVLQIIILLRTVNFWLYDSSIKIAHLNPTWFMPAVGNLIVPIAGVVHADINVSWFYFSIGIILWIALFTILLYRMIFHESIDKHLYPTLFIILAPPSIGFISTVKLTGSSNDFAKVLYFFGLFIFVLLLSKLNIFNKLEFQLSWWAFVFPLSAFNIATILMYMQSNQEIFRIIALVIYIFLFFLISIVVVKTMLAIYRKQICIED